MKKMKFILIGIGLVFQSCQSQPNFDLTTLGLKTQNIDSLITADIERQEFALGKSDKAYMNVRDDRFVYFNGVNLKGQQNPDSDDYGVNGISLYFNTISRMIYQYEVYIFSEQQAKDLLTALREKLGKPNYTGYRRAPDKEIDNFDALVWEDVINEHLYLFEYTLDQTIKAKLTVKDNVANIEDLNIFPPFRYWEDYLYARQRKNKEGYSYQKYLAEKLANNPDNIKNKLSK